MKKRKNKNIMYIIVFILLAYFVASNSNLLAQSVTAGEQCYEYGIQRCNNNVIETCQPEPVGPNLIWNPAKDCAAQGQSCQQIYGTGAVCSNECLPQCSYPCESGICWYACGDDGCGGDCGQCPGEYECSIDRTTCVLPGACQSNCEVGFETRCNANGDSEWCYEVEPQCLQWITKQECTGASTCVDGACLLPEDECVATTKRCVGNTVERCDWWPSDQSHLTWDTESTCQSNQICSEGSCIIDCIDNNQLIQTAGRWLNGQISDAQLLSLAQAWLTRGC